MSNLRCLEQALVWGRVRHGMWTTHTDAPDVHQSRFGLVYGRLPAGIVHLLDFGGVFGDKAVGDEEVAEGIVASCVTAGAPLYFNTFTTQTGNAAHHGVEARHVPGDVVQAGWAGQN